MDVRAKVENLLIIFITRNIRSKENMSSGCCDLFTQSYILTYVDGAIINKALNFCCLLRIFLLLCIQEYPVLQPS